MRGDEGKKDGRLAVEKTYFLPWSIRILSLRFESSLEVWIGVLLPVRGVDAPDIVRTVV